MYLQHKTVVFDVSKWHQTSFKTGTNAVTKAIKWFGFATKIWPLLTLA